MFKSLNYWFLSLLNWVGDWTALLSRCWEASANPGDMYPPASVWMVLAIDISEYLGGTSSKTPERIWPLVVVGVPGFSGIYSYEVTGVSGTFAIKAMELTPEMPFIVAVWLFSSSLRLSVLVSMLYYLAVTSIFTLLTGEICGRVTALGSSCCSAGSSVLLRLSWYISNYYWFLYMLWIGGCFSFIWAASMLL